MNNHRVSEKESPLTKKLYSSSFKSGERFSLNCSVENSPKIFMRQIRLSTKSNSIVSDRSHFHLTHVKDEVIDKYGRTKQQFEEEKSR